MRNNRRSGVLALIVLVAGGGQSAYAFKLKTHIAVANEALRAIKVSGAAPTVTVPPFGDLDIHNDEVVLALQLFPDFFRAGVTGPDTFPDLVGGQMLVHVNKGGLLCDEHKPGCEASDVPMEERDFDSWRSIDYGMYQLRRALDYRRDELTGEASNARLQAIAFSYGYLSHMIGDGFAHSYVNEWVRGIFDIFHGRPGTLFGPPTEELQHIAVEGYLDTHVQVPIESLRIAWPSAFLASMYTQPINGPDVKAPAPAGSFGGPYFEQVVKFRDLMAQLGDSTKWPGLAVPEPGASLLRRLIQIRNSHANILTAGTGIGDPVRDIEDYFSRRRQMSEALLNRWVDLSGCVAQNLVSGSALPPDQLLRIDACAAPLDFESDPRVHEIFDGALNEAARFGQDENPAVFSFGKLGNNLQKVTKFIQVIAEKMFVFKLTEDIRSIRVIKDEILRCEGPLIEWGTCQNACQAARQACASFTGLLCLCPDSCSSGALSVAICLANPLCLACDHVVNASCVVAVDSAAPVCTFCDQNPVCTALDAVEELEALQKRLIAEVLRPLLDKLKQEATDALLDLYFGPYVEAILALWQEFENNKAASSAAWFVNITFLQEDLRADPRYLERILQSLLGTSEALLSNAASAAEAAADTAQRTEVAGRRVLDLYIQAQSGELEARIWRGLLEILYRIAREQSFDAVTELRDDNPVYDWLDGFSFKSSQRQYDTRLARFVALVSELNLLTSIRGPTVTAFHNDLRIPADPPGGLAPVDLYVAKPTYNAIQLTKLGLLGGPALGTLVAGAVDGATPALRSSHICTTTPHIICDVSQSLDDPNHYGHRTEFSPAPDAERSVAYWISRDWQWRTGGVFQEACVVSPTDFMLAASQPRADRLYSKLFKYPDSCLIPGFGGFDDDRRPWTADTGTLTPNTTEKTQGSSSLQVNACGWVPIRSPQFGTAEFGTVGSEISFDIFIPAAQSNPSWVGDAQMTFSAPGANLFNAYLGWNGLTNLPRGAWSTLTFQLPSWVQAALLADTANAQFSILLNVASCQAPVLIDNLRMAGNLVSRTVPHRTGSEALSITSNPLFSFEAAGDWTSSQTVLGRNTSQKTHGDASLVVPSANWVEVRSRAFSTSEIPGVTAKLNLDVFVPAPQPNPYWGGAIQVYFSCPAAGLQNVYVGQQSLTNLFQNEFNSLVFDLPASVVNVLRTPNRTGCSLKLALNAPPANSPFLFDKLGFVN